MTISFIDGWEMIVRTAGSSNSDTIAGTFKMVHQAGMDRSPHFEEGGALTIPTAEASSRVLVQSKAGTTEYAD